jgi:hypothetical protein
VTARARRVSLLVVLAAAAIARWAGAAPSPLRAEPEVAVIAVPAGGSGSGAVVLHNETTAAVAVGSVTAEPGCDAAFVHAPPAGFTVDAGQTRSVPISCTPAPAGLERCTFSARSAMGAVLGAFEAVCSYASSTSVAADTSAVDFGAVQIGSPVSRTIALANSGATAIDRLFLETTDRAGNFAIAAPCNPDARACDAAIPVVPPGGSTSIVVACTPRTAEPVSAQLHVVTSAGARLATPIALSCTGQPAAAPVLSVVPGAIDVGAVEVQAATAATIVRITNAGADQLRLSDIQLVDGGAGGAADWRYTAPMPCGAAIPPTCSLGAGESIDLDVVFDPSAIGVREATLLVNFRDTADRTASIPLRGIGRGGTLDLVGGQAVLDFGTLPLDTPAALTFQVANRGTRDVAMGVLKLTPSGPPFTIAPGPTFMVPASAPTSFTVTCRPAASGMFTAHAQLSATDAASAPIDVTLRCTGDPATVLTATPPAVLLGEVRLASQHSPRVEIASESATTLSNAALEIANPAITVRGAPAPLPAMIELAVSPLVDGALGNRIVASGNTGPPLAIAVTGSAVTAKYRVPTVVSLGAFCVQQPTTPRVVELTSTGTATIGLMAPALQSADSPFDLELIAPLAYPGALAPAQRALVAVASKRRAVAGFVTDDLIWTTDVAAAATSRSKLTATFVDAGPAIAPEMLAFPDTPIHVDTRNAQQVTVQNCDVSALQLESPQIDAPFSIDSPPPPAALRPGQTIMFSVGFHPTRPGEVTKTLTINSPQLRTALTVTLTGTGIARGADPTGDVAGPPLEHTSFYACGSCASGDASIALAIAVALCVLRPRRRSKPAPARQ